MKKRINWEKDLKNRPKIYIKKQLKERPIQNIY